MKLTFPPQLSANRRELLICSIADIHAKQGKNLLGVFLGGSAARGLDQDRSDLDVIFVLEESRDSEVWSHPTDMELIRITLGHIERVATFGDSQWGYRWTYAWAPILLDQSNGKLAAAIVRHTRLTHEETISILVDHQVLDAWINLIYRALKSARQHKTFEARLDGAESISTMLDTVFALGGQVRPYNSYLQWSLREHQLDGWEAHDLLDTIQRTINGDADAIRRNYQRICQLCADYDARNDTHALQKVIDTWSGPGYDALRIP